MSVNMKYTLLLIGNLKYIHGENQATGTSEFKFSVADQEGNTFMDQRFIITIIGKLKWMDVSCVNLQIIY